MNSKNPEIEKEIETFKELTNCFIGTKAILFAYSPSFQELYIFFEKGSRYFVVKFADITYVKTYREWNFAGFRIEEAESKNTHYYRIYDRNYFEVICPFFGVLEILDGQDVVNTSNLI